MITLSTHEVIIEFRTVQASGKCITNSFMKCERFVLHVHMHLMTWLKLDFEYPIVLLLL